MTALEIAESAQAVVHDLRERLVAAERTVAALPARRQSLAFKASQGDKRAQARLGELLAGETEARAQVVTLQAALVEGRGRLEEARAAEREEFAREVSATAKRLAAAFLEQSEKIDKALAEIAAAFQRRAELRRALASTGFEDVAKLNCETRLRCAIAASGVYEILIGKGGPAKDDAVPLMVSDQRTLSSLRGAG